MSNQHPITPPPEMVETWTTQARGQDYCCTIEQVAYDAANWGYSQRSTVGEDELQAARDQELEACCEVILKNEWFASPSYRIAELKAARRPIFF